MSSTSKQVQRAISLSNSFIRLTTTKKRERKVYYGRQTKTVWKIFSLQNNFQHVNYPNKKKSLHKFPTKGLSKKKKKSALKLIAS